MAEITPKRIVEYKARRYAAGLKPASINRELASLKKAFNLAVREWEWCRENPVSTCLHGTREQSAGPMVQRGRGSTSSPGLCALAPGPVIFALHTGMRMGEILELTWRGSRFQSTNGDRLSFKERRTANHPHQSKPSCRS